MRPESAPATAIAALAEAQHGVVARAQLVERGLTDGGIARWVRGRRLHRLHRGVYAVGHRVLTVEGQWMAAVLAAGPGAALSHASAAAAWELLPPGGVIDVSVPTRGGRDRRRGVRIHRRGALTRDDVTVYRGIPVTTPACTIVDLARSLKGRRLEQLVDVADQRGLVDFRHLRAANSASLQAVLQRYSPAPTRSELEERFLRLCENHGIPRPQTNTLVEGIEVDFVWRDRRLIVEVDGYAYHRSPTAFETDRERDVTLTTNGWRVLRFTWAQVTRRSSWVAAAIRA